MLMKKSPGPIQWNMIELDIVSKGNEDCACNKKFVSVGEVIGRQIYESLFARW